MPTYEYACRDCGQHLEVVQSFKDAPLTTCGSCGGTLRKVFSAAGIIFKGSGYYVNDTRKQESESTSATSGEDGGQQGRKPTGDGGKTGDSRDSGKSPDGGTTSSDSGKSSSDSSAKGDAAESA